MMMQEKIVEKWKNELKATAEQYDKVLRQLKTENKHLYEK